MSVVHETVAGLFITSSIYKCLRSYIPHPSFVSCSEGFGGSEGVVQRSRGDTLREMLNTMRTVRN